MEPVRRLAEFWNWLPAFRVVAETEHLPTASKALHVTPSALSRTIRLLEDHLGQTLFERAGRRIVLTPAGHEFLASVRHAMRLVDDGLSTLQGREHTGPVTISVPGPFAPIFVLPALHEVHARHPHITGFVTGRVATDINPCLLRGELDIALLDDPLPSPELAIEPLATMTHGVYCAGDHPLRHRATIGPAELAEHPFVAPIPDPDGVTHDAWPPHLHRDIQLRVIQMQVAIRALADGRLLAALPDAVARAGGLHRLPVELMQPTHLFLVQRPELPTRGRTGVVVDAIRATARSLRDATCAAPGVGPRSG